MTLSARILWISLCFLPLGAGAEGVRITGAQSGTPVENDFAGNLPGTLLRAASLELLEPAQLTFTPVAAESGNHNTLTVSGLGSLSETRDFGFRAGRRGQLAGTFEPGTLDAVLAFSSDFGDRAVPGSSAFGVFVDGAAGGEFTTFYLVYDDTSGTLSDADYDDYVIRVDVQVLE